MNKTLVRIACLCAGVLVGFRVIFLVLDNLYKTKEDHQKSDAFVSDVVDIDVDRLATSDSPQLTSVEVPERIVDLEIPDQLFDLKVAIWTDFYRTMLHGFDPPEPQLSAG